MHRAGGGGRVVLRWQVEQSASQRAPLRWSGPVRHAGRGSLKDRPHQPHQRGDGREDASARAAGVRRGARASVSAEHYTDDLASYQGLPNHTAVTHSIGEYVSGQAASTAWSPSGR